MPAIKDIVRHVSVETAGKKRPCHRHKARDPIVKGQTCLVVKDGPQSRSTYCVSCADEILNKAAVRLTELRNALDL